jgi:hypothetical protein
MAIQIVEAATAGQRREFIHFQWEIYRDDPHWVPPLLSERNAFYDKSRNLFFKHSDAALFLAYRDGALVGTIAAIHNTRHNAKWNDKVGFFGAFECRNDEEAARALFDAAENWIAARGLNVLRGPATLSLNDECGLLIDGFDSPPVLMMTYNPRYYADLIERSGFAKSMDLLAWWVSMEQGGKAVADRFGRVAQMAQKRGKFTVRSVDLKRIDEEFEHIKGVLYSGPWEQNWGHVTPTDEEMSHLVHNLKQIADQELVLIAELDGKAIGVAASIPDVNEALRKAYPRPGTPEIFTLLKFLWHKRSVKTVRFLVLGVDATHRMAGIDAALAVKTYEIMLRKGYVGAECSWILESNDAMNRIIELGGGRVYKRYRMYDRPVRGGRAR